jgi:Cu/Ag efflux pump CusA
MSLGGLIIAVGDIVDGVVVFYETPIRKFQKAKYL